jgi:serine/threonine protein kinase
MTRLGVILGTAACMSPEQAIGKTVDKRAGIWAFGCILYECLTGKRAFEGDTITETLASFLKNEPDWQTLPVTVPSNIRFLLRRCLEKDVNRRFHHAAEPINAITAQKAMTLYLFIVPPLVSAICQCGRLLFPTAWRVVWCDDAYCLDFMKLASPDFENMHCQRIKGIVLPIDCLAVRII